MNLLLYVDLKNRKFVSSLTDSAEVTTLNFRQGDTVRMCIQPVEEIGSDAASEVLYRVVPFRLSSEYGRIAVGLGYIDKAPLSGTYKISVQDGDDPPVTTAAIAFNATKQQVQTALNAVALVSSNGNVTVVGAAALPADELGAKHVHQLYWNTPSVGNAEITFTISANKLSPDCFTRKWSYASAEFGTVHVLKFFQSPLAFWDVFTNPIPASSVIARVRAGSETRNEVQSISFDTNSKSTFSFTWGATPSVGGATTPPLPVNSTSVVVQDALNALYSDGLQRFKVTNMRRGAHYIEFIGMLGNLPQELLVINMEEHVESQFAYGELPMGGTAIELALAGAASIPVKFEMEISSVGSAVDTPIIIDATIENDMIDDEVALYHDPEWLGEIQDPVGHVEHDEGQIIYGNVHYEVIIGDTIASAIEITHGLSTLDLHVTVRENFVGGTIIPDDQYLCEILTVNTVRLTFSSPPSSGQFVALVSSAAAESHWLGHEHEIDEINGLQAALDALALSGDELELWPQIPVDKIPLEELIAAIAANPDGVLTTLTEAIITNIQTDSSSLATFVEMFTTVLEGEPTLIDAIAESLTTSEAFVETLKTVFTTNEELTNTVVKSLIEDPDFRAAVASAFQLGTAISTSVIPISIPAFSDVIEGHLGFAMDVGGMTTPPKMLPYTGTFPRASDANRGYFAKVVTKAYAGPERKKTFPHNAWVYSTGRDWFEGSILGGPGDTLPVPGTGEIAWAYPKEYEKELFTVSLTPEMLALGTQFSVSWSVTLQLLANCEGFCTMRLRRGTMIFVGDDVQSITWDETSIIDVKIHITDAAITHGFAYQVKRPLTGDMEAKKIEYTQEIPASVPIDPSMVLRAELINFDMENAAEPQGKLIRSMQAAVASIVKL